MKKILWMIFLALPAFPQTINPKQINPTDFKTLQGTMNSDQFISGGGNNGISNAQASITCNTTGCLIVRPPTSTDTEAGGVLGPVSGKPSSYVIDERYFGFGQYAVNPGIAPIFQGINQVMQPEQVTYTTPSQGTTQGAAQFKRMEVNNWNAPGYTGVPSGSLNPPGPGYTAAAQWANPTNTAVRNYFHTSGIKGDVYRENHCDSIGDCDAGITCATLYEGGITAPSDEGGKGCMNVSVQTEGDFFGTITSITDSYHLLTGSLINPNTQGNGRFLYDTSVPVIAPGLNRTINLVNQAGSGHPVGTVVWDAPVSLPVSYVWGTADTCTVPIQEGTFFSATCTFNIQGGSPGIIDVTGSGANDGKGLFCTAEDHFGNANYGVQVTHVGAPSGGVQTATLLLYKPLQTGGGVTTYFFQGGTCADLIVLDVDNQSYGGANSLVTGSGYPSIGSYDAQTMTYVAYNASQLWAGMPQRGSFFKSTRSTTDPTPGLVPGGIALTNVVRVSNVATANFFSQGTNQDFITGITSGVVLSGCSDSSFNGVVPGTPNITALLPQPVLTFPSPGSNSSCSAGAVITPTFAATASVLPMAEVVSVMNATTGAVDGSFVHTYQPAFSTGDVLELGPYPMMAIEGAQIVQNMSEPTIGGQTLRLVTAAVSSFQNSAILIDNSSAEQFRISGAGGTANLGDMIDTAGPYQNLITAIAPAHFGYVIAVGDAYASQATPLQSFSYLGAEVGSFNESDLGYDISGQLIGSPHTFYFRNGQGVGEGPFNASITFSPSGMTAYAPLSIGATTPNNPNGIGQLVLYDGMQSVLKDTFTFPGGGSGAGFLANFALDNVVVPPVPVCGATCVPATTQYHYTLMQNFPAGCTSNCLVSISPLAAVFNGPASLSGSSVITIPCSTLPSGYSGSIWFWTNPIYEEVGICTSSSTILTDTGTYLTTHAASAISAGGRLNMGTLALNGTGGTLAWMQPNIFPDTSGGATIVTQFSQTSAGNLSLDTTAQGNHLGNLTVNNLTVAGTCTGCGGGGGSGTVTSIATTGPISGGTITTSGTISCPTCTITIASGATAMGTGAISSGACATVVTATATGTATTDVLAWSFNGDVTAITGYAPVTTGTVTVYVYPTANTANFKICNSTASSITPGAVTLNWRVTR